MIVMKFGGTSVGSLERIDHVASLVLGVEGAKAVVVSAMGGTTDALLRAAQSAESGDWSGALQGLDAIATQHRAAVDSRDDAAAIEALLGELREILHGVNLLRETTRRTRALLVSFGERMSAPLVSAAIRRQGLASFAVDARDLVRTDDKHEEASDDFAVTRSAVREALLARIETGEVPVITGF
ncbi:MAG: hypothetical protein GWP91_24930, partial [Rhodobacterales bacterium]|nr:hypothetical protein [Rhodobacterales bacterium]